MRANKAKEVMEGSVTDAQYFSEDFSASRNDPDCCLWCRERFAPGQVRYPIVDCSQWPSPIASMCMDCFKAEYNNESPDSGIRLERFRRDCAGCGEPMLTPARGRFRWLVCSNRCYQRDYRKRRYGQDSTVPWKGGHMRCCQCCKTPIRSKRRDARFCCNACRQRTYRRRRKNQ
jgi:hypothetical protein